MPLWNMAIASLLWIPLAAAQGVPITGVVLDPTGVPIPNAAVVLNAGRDRIAEHRTAADGAFRFENVAPGAYEVVVRRHAFEESVSRIRVGARAPNPLRIRLKLADLRQEITVTDTRNRINTQIADNLDVPAFDRAMLDRLPAMNNDPLAAIMRFVDATSLGDGGVEILVDGMPSSAKVVSPSAIQEIRINQNPYTAEFNGHGGSRIEIISASAMSAYHGAFNYLFRDHHLDARPGFAATRPPDHRNIFEGNLTGPAGKGTSFLVSGESVHIGNNPIVVARTLDGDVRLNSPLTVRESSFAARLNRQWNKNHQISFRFEFDDESVRGAGIGGFTLPEAGSNVSAGERQFHIQHRATLTPRLVHELQFRAGYRSNATRGIHPDAVRIVVPGAFTGGGAQNDSSSSESRAQWHWTLSYVAGRHAVKTGVSSPDVNRRTLVDRSNFLGTYTFPTLDDYRLGRPLSFQQQQGEPRIRLWVKEAAAFVEDEYRLRPGLSLSLGLRWDWQNYFGDNNNFAPRLAFAWAPGRSRKTVVRGGGGYFYDRGQWRPLADTRRYDGLRLRDILIRTPGYPNPFAGGAVSSPPPSISRFDPTIRTPYRLMYNLGVERQLPKAVIAIVYRGHAATKSYRSRDVNAPYPGTTERVDPSIGVLRNFESSAGLRARHLELTLRTQSTKRFSGTMQYVRGRARNNTDGLYAFPANNWDLSLEWAPHDEIRRHRFQTAGTVKVPRLGDLGVIFQAASGGYFDLTTGRDDNRDGFARDRPPGVRRNSLLGPGFAELDARWSREFILDRKKSEKGPVLTVGADASNVINKFNAGQMVGNQSSPFFLQPVSSRTPRRMMLFARLRF